MFKGLKLGDALVFDGSGYRGTIPAKCIMCHPEPLDKLDRVFIVTSNNGSINYEQVEPEVC